MGTNWALFLGGRDGKRKKWRSMEGERPKTEKLSFLQSSARLEVGWRSLNGVFFSVFVMLAFSCN